MSTKITHLAPEVQSQLLGHLDAFDVANLWMTGSKPMQTTLLLSCEEFRMVIIPGQGIKQKIKPCPWPGKFISLLPHLKRVIISLGIIRVLERGSWLDFPRSIQQLSITAMECWTLFYETDISPNNAHDIKLHPSSPVIKIGSLFPDLKNLTLYGRHLAPSLAEVNQSIIQSLPSTLETLHIFPGVSFSSAMVASLPPSITSLSIAAQPNDRILGKKLSSFNLTSLTLSEVPFWGDDIKFLPKTLLQLDIRSVQLSMRYVQDLPQNLERLILATATQKTPFDFVLKFPPKLKYLTCHSDFPIEDNDIQNLPSNLESLRLISMSDVTDIGFKQLPKTITSLAIYRAPYLTSQCVATLPRNMKYLQFGSVPQVLASCIPLLPPTLTRLGLDLCHDIKDQDIKHLPRSLTSFTCNSAHLTSLSVPDFPPNLTEVYFSFDLLDLNTGERKAFHELVLANRQRS